MTDASENPVLVQLAREVSQLHEGLARFDYYEFLGLERTCDYIAVRDAFYARAQRFHPDRFVVSDSDSLKQAAYAVYKRMTESYQVLMDPELRRAYDEARTEGAIRLSAEKRARRLDAQERQVSNAFARIYLRSARAKLERENIDGAWIDVELGLSLDKAAPLEKLREVIVKRMTER